MSHNNIAVHNEQMKALGLVRDESTVKKARFGPHEYQKVTYTDKPEGAQSGKLGMLKRAGYAAATALMGPALLSRAVQRQTLDKVRYGRTEEKVYYGKKDPLAEMRYAAPAKADSAAPNRLVEWLGYDPKDKVSLQEFFEENRGRFELSNGHYILRQEWKGMSGIIFVPNGDDKNIAFYSLYNPKNGKPLSGTKFRKAIEMFTYTYNSDMENFKKSDLGKKINKILIQRRDELKDQIKEIKNDLEIDPTEKRDRINTLKKKIHEHEEKLENPERYGGFTRIIRPKDGQSQIIFGGFDPNNMKKGAIVSWSDETQKEVKEIWKTTTDGKLKDNEKPFAKPAPAA